MKISRNLVHDLPLLRSDLPLLYSDFKDNDVFEDDLPDAPWNVGERTRDIRTRGRITPDRRAMIRIQLSNGPFLAAFDAGL